MAKKKTEKDRRLAYLDDVAAEICEQGANGLALKKICASGRMPARSTVYNWFGKHLENMMPLPTCTRARGPRRYGSDGIVTNAATTEDSDKARLLR